MEEVVSYWSFNRVPPLRSEDGSSANEGTDMAGVEAASDEYAEATIGAINAPASNSPATIGRHDCRNTGRWNSAKYPKNAGNNSQLTRAAR